MSLRSVPAPVGGWNVRDSLDSMKEDEAVTLDNFFPDIGKVSLRSGFTSHATGMGDYVETLAEFHSGSTRKLIAAANGKIWDATSAGAATQLGTGYTNNRWQTCNMDGKMGFVNGADAPLDYDGTTLGAMTISGTGLTVANIIGIHVFKTYSWVWEDNSQDVWYSAVNTLGGTMNKFPLSRVGNFGGKLVSMGTWSVDSGNGPDDYAVFVMSSGEVIVYQGTDPSDASAWAIVGVYHTGQPVNVRGTVKIGGDLIIITRDGYIPMSAIVSKGKFAKGSAISDKIRGAVQTATLNYGSNFGWQAIYYPAGNRILFNVPVVENTESHQHVYNTITGAWCRFKGMNASSWSLYSDDLYFGGNGVVYKADNGKNDADANIEADAVTAFNYLGNRTNIKSFTGVQPVFAAEGSLSVAIAFAVDFSIPGNSAADSQFSATGDEWNVATWNLAEWVGGENIVKAWHNIFGLGYNCALRVTMNTKDQFIRWYSTNYMFKKGGVI